MSKHEPSIGVQLAAGGFSGFCEQLLTQPLDAAKTRLQLGHGGNVLQCVRDMYREGGVKRLYRGVLPPLVSMIPKNAVYMTAQHRTADELKRMNWPMWVQQAVAGAVSGVPEGFIVTPFETVKVRLMAKENLGLYKDTWDCGLKVWRSEGLSGLMQGLEATCVRNMVWTGCYFLGLHCLEVAPSSGSSSWLRDRLQRFSAGCASGVFATTVNNSLDVIKSRVQQCSPHVALPYNRAWHRHSTLANWVHLARTEGLQGLFKGYSAKVLRMGLGGW